MDGAFGVRFHPLGYHGLPAMASLIASGNIEVLPII
jgi:hypothetical protein